MLENVPYVPPLYISKFVLKIGGCKKDAIMAVQLKKPPIHFFNNTSEPFFAFLE
jgi:hypothetical protein